VVALALGLVGVWAGLRLLGWAGSAPPSSPSSGTTVSAPPPSGVPLPTPAVTETAPTPAPPAPPSPAAQPPTATPAVSSRPAAAAERPVAPPRAATPQRAPDAPSEAAPATGATTSPYDLASRYRGEGEPARRGKLRVYCEPSLDVVLFPNTDAKDVADSAKDLREALVKRAQVEIVPSRAQADAVVQVLERGRQPARFGMRKVRVRVAIGAESLEILGQDSAASFNTWSGAAGGAARQIEAWLARRSPAARP
jgi:cytoskeletal protein RodZ